MIRTLVVLLCSLSLAGAADFYGTWKLNVAKSKYVGVAAPKEQTVTYTAKGSGYDYSAVGKTATGEDIKSSFTYVKDGEEIKVTGFPYWDAIVMKNGASAKTSGKLMRGGKQIGTVSRTLSADGKTIAINAKLTLPDGKPASYQVHYDKQ